MHPMTWSNRPSITWCRWRNSAPPARVAQPVPALRLSRRIRSAPAFKRGESCLEGLQLRTRALEHARLRVKLIAAHEVELAQPLAQHRAEVSLQVLLHAAQCRRHAFQQPAGDLIDTK